MTDWKNFLLAYLAVFLMIGGAAGFFGFHDKVYHYDYRTAQDSPPPRMNVVTYEVLPPDQQAMVDKSIAGEQVVNIAEEQSGVPPHPVVRKDGTYHVFNSYATFDWLDIRTLAPLGVAAVGIWLAIRAIRGDISGQVTT